MYVRNAYIPITTFEISARAIVVYIIAAWVN